MEESTPTDDLFGFNPLEGMDKEDLDAAVEEMERQSQAVISEDVSDLFGDEEQEWFIPTGKFNEDGQPKVFRVTVKDPMDPALPTKYFMAMQRNPKGAIRALWKSCVVQPRAICDDDETYKRLSSSFRMSMNLRIMELIGVNQDFLETTQSVTGGRKAPPRPTKSSGKSPGPGSATQENSQGGAAATSTPPTGTSSSNESKSGETSSPTLASSSPEPSAASEPAPSVIPSRSAGGAVPLGQTQT